MMTMIVTIISMKIKCKYDELMPLVEIEKRWHPDNENNHPEEQIRSLAKVIAKIGIRHPIHISILSGKIAGGHGRYLAFKKLGYDNVPIVWEEFEDELEELNYRASDNLGQYAEFDKSAYVDHLKDFGLDLVDIDLEEFGIIDTKELIVADCDIEVMDNFSTEERFIVRCDDQGDLESLQSKLNITSKEINFKKLLGFLK